MAACGREPPEQRLRLTVAAMQEAVEKGKPKDFMEPVADDFVGNGGLDRAGLERLLKGQLLLSPNVTVQTGPLSVEMGANDTTATVRFSMLLAGGSGRFVPERGDMQELVSGWREEEGQWRLYSASWKPMGAD
ncbi:MAG: nuclear transport factor 2 family protein [Stenotrophomonas sp.]|uniref:nuclear transport factor 2 family protein n=1 Tax=Stenotrophomonas sp. TaxID=69392 RepID=UPI003D6CC663